MNFATSFTDSNNDIAITLNNGQLVILDESNYSINTENGHTQSDFSSYRTLSITDPDNNTFTYSTLYPTDGSNALTVAAAGQTLPIQTNFTVSQDGLYSIILTTVPTWNGSDVPYIYSATNPICVFYNGNI